jgi:hypothetical protein
VKKTFLLSVPFALFMSFVFVSCQKELSLENAVKNGGTAQYSFDGGTGTCSGANVAGSFTAGVAVTADNTVTLSVTVDSIGTYMISTNTNNGITFSGSGVFTDIGVQDVTLMASGTPAVAGSFAFVPGINGCSFDVAFGSDPTSGGNTGGNATAYLKCKIDGVLTNFNTKLVGYYVTPPSAGIPYSISVQGTNSDVAGSAEELWVNASNPTALTTGAYSNITFSNGTTDKGCQVGLYPTGFPNPFWGSSPLNANTFTVNVTSVSTSAAAGTFQGTLYEANGIGPSTRQITEGEFKIVF